MKTMKKNIKIFRCDNAGKNNTLKENCAENAEEIKFEFTSPGIPHQKWSGIIGI